ncbi:MAG: hypothetical protein ISS17_08230 [Bacteroidales bacterium]|nr:hypothetical protein [Bacteroidales bacterium]
MRLKIFIALAMVFQNTSIQAQSFQQFIDYLNALPENQRQDHLSKTLTIIR